MSMTFLEVLQHV